MKRLVVMFSIISFVVVCLSMNADARSQYKNAYAKKQFAPETEAEKAVGAAIAKDSCNACHIKGKPKKMHNEYGTKLGKLLPKYDKTLWKSDLDKAVSDLREAINKVK